MAEIHAEIKSLIQEKGDDEKQETRRIVSEVFGLPRRGKEVVH